MIAVDPDTLSISSDGAVRVDDEALRTKLNELDTVLQPYGSGTNSGVCSGNNMACSNTGDCSGSDNTGRCSNSGRCVYVIK
ncbi:hypothetical protein [Dokdonella sp.]|uniref:hypothetical protein n=1 Tax=Dokdonella sp. TaxID=2291710 RepID=UPI0031BF8C61|nr:hypothetical protein [Dokdonella sp.]